MASGGGGAWKVAYADFVTAMMAFFMVMWLTSQKPEVVTAVAQHFRNPGGSRMTGNDAKSMVPSSKNGNGNRRITKERKQNEGDAKARKMSDEGEKSNVGSVVLFPVNSIEITEEAKKTLLALIPELEGKLHRIEVRGHSASTGTTSQATIDSWNISYKRSIAVAQFLEENGIDSRRLRPSAAGNSEPRYVSGEVDQSSDSRVEVYVLTDIFEEPASKTERLTSGKVLDAQAAEEAAQQKAAAAAAPPAKGGH